MVSRSSRTGSRRSRRSRRVQKKSAAKYGAHCLLHCIGPGGPLVEAMPEGIPLPCDGNLCRFLDPQGGCTDHVPPDSLAAGSLNVVLRFYVSASTEDAGGSSESVVDAVTLIHACLASAVSITRSSTRCRSASRWLSLCVSHAPGSNGFQHHQAQSGKTFEVSGIERKHCMTVLDGLRGNPKVVVAGSRRATCTLD